MAVLWHGHRVWTESGEQCSEFVEGVGTLKYWTACSCGFRSMDCATEASAVTTAVSHLWRTSAPEMTRDEFERLLRAELGAKVSPRV